MMLKLWFLSLTLIITTWFGLRIQEDPGYLLISYKLTAIEMPLWVAFVGILLIFCVAYISLYFISSTLRAFNKVKEKWSLYLVEKRNKNIQDGYLALAIEDWKLAEKSISKAIEQDKKNVVNYLSIAKVAQKQGDIKKRDEYLEKAYKINDGNHDIDLVKADLLFENKSYKECLDFLEKNQRNISNHKSFLKLLFKCHYELKNWQDILNIFPKLKKYSVIEDESLIPLEKECYTKLLSEYSDNLAEFSFFWKCIPKNISTLEELSIIGSDIFFKLNDNEMAIEVIEKSLEKNWSEKLAIRYGLIIENPKKQLKNLEKWLINRPNSPSLLLSLGRLCLENKLESKAEQHFIECINNNGPIACYAELGKLKESQGDIENAHLFYKQGTINNSKNIK